MEWGLSVTMKWLVWWASPPILGFLSEKGGSLSQIEVIINVVMKTEKKYIDKQCRFYLGIKQNTLSVYGLSYFFVLLVYFLLSHSQECIQSTKRCFFRRDSGEHWYWILNSRTVFDAVLKCVLFRVYVQKKLSLRWPGMELLRRQLC